MPDKEVEPAKTVTKKVKEQGAISKIWDSSTDTAVNSFDIVSVGTKSIANTFRLANEIILPNIIEARFDTQVSLTEAVLKLTELGADPVVAMEYLKRDIM